MKPFRTGLKQILFLFCLAGLLESCSRDTGHITLAVGPEDPRVEFALAELMQSLQKVGVGMNPGKSGRGNFFVTVDTVDSGLEPEGFLLNVGKDSVRVTAVDVAGIMYGLLELAEQIRLYGLEGVKDTRKNPYMELRGVKFNIPLDARTPSYSDLSDAGQKNIPEVWNLDFWKEFIDQLARCRYNFISLWSLHPFPSLVEVPGYEDVALEDVWRSTTKWKEYSNLNGVGFSTPEILSDPEIVREMTMEEKIRFWREVMAYGQSRNIDFYVVTWNIFVNGTGGKYGISDAIRNPVTRDYFRKSVKQMFITYPDLKGIGITTGENMPGAGFGEKENWVYETYGQGVLDAAREMPERKITFIHRQHQTGASEIIEKFRPLVDQENIEFLFSFKYAKAHVMSATRQPYHKEFVREIGEMKTLWTLRNDDAYMYRWGAPDFVRDFIRNIPYDVSRGFYYGSDQWIWGREFLAQDPASPRQLEITKHWYHWMMWGRLGYDPGMEDDRFNAILQGRFPEVDGASLFEAWQEASMVYPVTTGFHWGSLDFQWYIEACKSRPEFALNETGFHDVNRFITLPPHPLSGYQSIPDFVEMMNQDGTSSLVSPLEVSRLLHMHADRALEIIGGWDPGENRELKATLHDIRTMALLGRYYACKIEGAAQLALFRETGETSHREEAVDQLRKALKAWKEYTGSSVEMYHNPVWLNRVGYVDWARITEWAARDIEIAMEE